MTELERLYDTMGELLYAIAMADGEIQPEELTTLDEVLKGHPWAEAAKWSFNYEKGKNSDVDTTYQKVIAACHAYGPSPIYNDFISAMTKVAEAVGGIDPNEEKIINNFSKDLTERFQKDTHQ